MGILPVLVIFARGLVYFCSRSKLDIKNLKIKVIKGTKSSKLDRVIGDTLRKEL